MQDERIVEAHRGGLRALAIRELEAFAGTGAQSGAMEDGRRATRGGGISAHVVKGARPQLQHAFTVFKRDLRSGRTAMEGSAIVGHVRRDPLGTGLPERTGVALQGWATDQDTAHGFGSRASNRSLIERFSKRSQQRKPRWLVRKSGWEGSSVTTRLARRA